MTALERLCGLTVVCTKVNGATVEKTAKASLMVKMAPSMRVNGWTESTTEGASCRPQTGRSLQVSSRMESSSVDYAQKLV